MLDGVFRRRRSTRSNLSGRCSRVVVVVRSGCSVWVADVVVRLGGVRCEAAVRLRGDGCGVGGVFVIIDRM